MRSGGHGCPEERPRLAALLDGELSPDEEVLLREHVAACSRCAEDLAEQERTRAGLRHLAGALQAPSGLRQRIEHGSDGARFRRPRLRGALLFGGLAASLVLIAALALARVAIRAPSDGQVASAAAAHVQETLAATPVAFRSADADAVAAWIQQQSGQRIEVVSFASADYQLLGARMEPALGPRAVSLVYEGAGGRLTCVILPPAIPAGLEVLLPAAAPALRSARVNGSTEVSWADRDASYILVGQGDAQTLLRLAQMAAASS
jgi:anti-sigma factor RsiW